MYKIGENYYLLALIEECKYAKNICCNKIKISSEESDESDEESGVD